MPRYKQIKEIDEDKTRYERLTLSEQRDMMYEKFRTNIRVLRAITNLSGVEASKNIGLKHGRRLIQLEYGTGSPSMEEMILISKFYGHPIDDILNKNIKITFE